MSTDNTTKYALWVVAGLIAAGTITHCNAEPVPTYPGYEDECIVEYWQTGPSCG